MYWEDPTGSDVIPVSKLSRVAMTALMIAIIGSGVYPRPILDALRPRASVPVAAVQR